MAVRVQLISTSMAVLLPHIVVLLILGPSQLNGATARYSAEEAAEIRAQLAKAFSIEEPAIVTGERDERLRYTKEEATAVDDDDHEGKPSTELPTKKRRYTPEVVDKGLLHFDLPVLEPGEKIVSAKLHVAPWHVNSLIHGDLVDSPMLQLNIDDVVPLDEADSEDNDGQTRVSRLNSKVFLNKGGEWSVFDIRRSVRRWTGVGGDGKGRLRMQVEMGPQLVDKDNLLPPLLEKQQSVRDLKQTTPVLRISLSGGKDSDGHEEEDSYNDDDNDDDTGLDLDAGQARERRSVSGQQGVSSTICKAYRLRVPVSAIGWDDFIVYPTVFDINYCDGGCPFPLNVASRVPGVKGTPNYSFPFHASFQAFIHNVHWRHRGLPEHDVPPPSCAPVAYDSPITLVYVSTSTGMAITKLQPELRVIDCACN